MSSIKKSFAGVMIAAFVFAGFATPAKAQTVAELQALVNQLMAQIAAMSGNTNTGTSCGYVHSMTLRQGSTGSQVMAMQSALGIAADGKFGPMTASAVRSFQTSKGLGADGVVGPMTGAAIASSCTSTPSTGGNTGSTGSMDLDGTDGTINDVKTLSQYSNEEVGEGEEDVIVLGLEVEASNDGDIMLNSVRVSMDPAGNTGSDNLDDYVDEVTVWFGDKKVGSADANDFSQGSNDIYTRTITLKGVKIDADETEKLYVAVSAVNNLDSGDLSGDSWTMGVDSIRFTDGSGVVTTESGAGDLPVSGVTMNFVDFGTAADTEFKISKDSDSPEAGIVIVDDENGKDEVTLLMGKFRVTGNSDVVLDEMPVTFTVSAGVLSNMANSLTLKIDGEEYTESSTTTSGGLSATVVFDNLDLDINAGDSVEFEVLADINGTDDFAEGYTLTASITSDNRSAIDLENEEGDQVVDSDKTGTAIGEAQEFRSEGVAVTLVGNPTAVSGGDNSTTGTYAIKFKVEAVGDDVYVGTVANSSKYAFAVQDSTQTATTGGVSAVITNQGGNGNSTSTTSGGNWKINEGTSASFTLTLSRADGAAGLFRAVMTGLRWTTDDTDAVTSSDNLYNSNMEDFVTDFLTLN